ncbi:hypothetical protein V1284_002363 [Nitrobacteraceae bacterium AZCC 2299]
MLLPIGGKSDFICRLPYRTGSFYRTLLRSGRCSSHRKRISAVFFYGINFEISNSNPKFAQNRIGIEIRPIIGVRNADWEFIVNPIVDLGIGKYGQADFAPAARVARKLDQDVFVGLEYYADFGEIGHFGKVAEQQHTLFAVTDFKFGIFDVDFGLGYGLTPSSDRLVAKTIVGYAFPVPGGSPAASERATAPGPINPMARSSARIGQP